MPVPTRQLIKERLLELVNQPCPRCSNDEFSLETITFFGIAIRELLSEKQKFGGFGPCVALTCDRCGYYTFHNTSKLGIKIDRAELRGISSK